MPSSGGFFHAVVGGFEVTMDVPAGDIAGDERLELVTAPVSDVPSGAAPGRHTVSVLGIEFLRGGTAMSTPFAVPVPVTITGPGIEAGDQLLVYDTVRHLFVPASSMPSLVSDASFGPSGLQFELQADPLLAVEAPAVRTTVTPARVTTVTPHRALVRPTRPSVRSTQPAVQHHAVVRLRPRRVVHRLARRTARHHETRAPATGSVTAAGSSSPDARGQLAYTGWSPWPPLTFAGLAVVVAESARRRLRRRARQA